MLYPCPLCDTETGLCSCARDCGHPMCDGQEGVAYGTDVAARARSHFARTGELASHGNYGYQIGCRCRICTAASAIAQKKYRDIHPPRVRGRVDSRVGAVCPECHRMARVVATGVFGKHRAPDNFGPCWGSGKRPVDEDASAESDDV